MVTLVSTANLCLSVRRSTKTMLAVGLTQNSLTAIADAELCLCCCPFFSELRDGQICSITVHHLPYRACLHHGALCLLHPPCLFTDSGWKGLIGRMNQITGRRKTLLGRTVHFSPNMETGLTSSASICVHLFARFKCSYCFTMVVGTTFQTNKGLCVFFFLCFAEMQYFIKGPFLGIRN